MAAEVAAADVAVDGLDMFLTVDVGADIFHKVVVDQPFGHSLDLFSIIAGETQNIYLEVHAVGMKGGQAATVPVIIDISLGMGKDKPVTLHFELKQGVVEIPGLLNERVFNKQPVPGHRGDGFCCYLRECVIINAKLGRMTEIYLYSGLVKSVPERVDCGSDRVDSIWKHIFGHMRSSDYTVDSPALQRLDKFHSLLHGRGSVINAGKHMTMEVG